MSLSELALPVLPKYELLEEIGHGGMATVYRALDKRLGREVAVKIIHRHLRQSTEVAQRFAAEARAVAKLRHPNIVEIYDVSDSDISEHYLVAELVMGKSLRKVLEEQPALPAEITACMGVELASALAHAHQRGVIHRDVKPENVLLGIPLKENEAPNSLEKDAKSISHEPHDSLAIKTAIVIKITDFGIAKMLDQQGVTSTGQVLGSPAYMAPEQIECAEVDARSDVFALGALLYECMVGHVPFDGKNPAQVLRRVLDGTFARPEWERPSIGAQLGAVVTRALAHQPSDRYPSMTELQQALTSELSALGITKPLTEIAHYLQAPQSYEQSLKERLVPRLLERGQTAYRTGDSIGAAGHFNRALALAPHNAAVLTQVTRFMRHRARRTMLLRTSMAAGALTVIGGISWAIMVSILRRPPMLIPVVSASRVQPPSELLLAEPTASGSASSQQASATPRTAKAVPVNVSPSIASPLSGVGMGASSSQLPNTATHRTVRFLITPRSAFVQIDGGPEEGGGFELVKILPVGHHAYVGYVKENNPCCARMGGSFDVPAASESNEPYSVSITLPFKSAILSSKGPPGAKIQCAMFGIHNNSARGSYPVSMHATEEQETCVLLSEEGRDLTSKIVTLRAGETEEVKWELLP